MKTVEKIIKKIDRLKPIPQVANKIMSLAEDPNSSMSQLTDVISYDQALTSNLLKVCNSAYFGLSREVESVHQAVVYLGMDQLVDMVVLNCGSENFNRKQEGYDLDKGELWRYSVSSALIAKDLAEKKGQKDNPRIFTAALIKDIGKVVLSQYVDDAFEKINALVTDGGYSFREAEKAVIGIDHAELGGMVAEKWKFSPKMVDIIRNHHLHDESAKNDLETAIVYLADTLCMMMGIGGGADGLYYRFHKEVIESLGFTDKDFQEIMANFGTKLQLVEEMIKYMPKIRSNA